MLIKLSRTFLLLALSWSCANAWAGGGSFGVKPPFLSLSGAPGSTVMGSFQIENSGSKPNTYTITVRGRAKTSKGYSDLPLGSLPPNSVVRKLSISSKQISIPARATKKVTFSVELPTDFSGTEYAYLTVSQGTEQVSHEDDVRSTEYEKKVGLGIQTAVTITVTINPIGGGAEYSMNLDSIVVRGATASKPLSALVTLSNTGGVEIKIDPILILLDSKGNAVARLKSDRTVKIAPGTKTTEEFILSGSTVAAGTYKAILSIPNPNYKFKPLETTITVK